MRNNLLPIQLFYAIKKKKIENETKYIVRMKHSSILIFSIEEINLQADNDKFLMSIKVKSSRMFWK